MIAAKMIELLCRRRSRSFIHSLSHFEETQLSLKQQLFHSLMKGKYGQHLKAKVWDEIPIVNYQEIEKWIETSSLSHSSVKHYVETSGSSCRSKKIPYTAELKQSFLSLFKIWAYDLLKNVLKPDPGKIFMSLSSPTQSGLKDDTQYLNQLLKVVLKPYLILPPIDHSECYHEIVARALFSEKNLGIISIWNPTYLLQIMEYIETHRERFNNFIGDGAIDWKHLWPKLQLISCWTDGWAAAQSEILKKQFPHAILQGKGLLATEAPMTVPLQNSPAPVPLIDEVYFEFEDSSGNIKTLGQVHLGETYELIISQKEGLIRYRIGDKVKVSGCFLTTPCLTFVGRAGRVCDMVGEKLDSLVVEDILNEIPQLQTGASLLLPVYSAHPSCHYMLLTEQIDAHLPEVLESGLQKIYHYRVARLTRLLGPVKVIQADRLLQKFHQFYLSQGINRGDIKDTRFIHDPSLAAQFLTLSAL